MSTHNLCFGAKIRKLGITLHSRVIYRKMGYEQMKGYTFHSAEPSSVTLYNPDCQIRYTAISKNNLRGLKVLSGHKLGDIAIEDVDS